MQHQIKVLIACLAFIYCFGDALCCNKYKIKINHIKSCLDNGIVRPKNVTYVLDKNCMLIGSGCTQIAKAFKTAKAKYTVTKAPLINIEDNLDVCKGIKDSKSKVGSVLASIGLKCPQKAGVVCTKGTKKTDLSSLKSQLSLAAGNIKVKIEIEHDSGKSCLDLDFDIKQ